MSKLSKEAVNVKNALIEQGIETPMVSIPETKDIRRQQIESHIHEVIRLIGLDLKDDSIEETPKRLAKMFIDEIFTGMNYENFPKITNIKNTMSVEEMVLVDRITLMSTCEHHFVTIDGLVSVAYFPKDWVIGLSKINRIVEFFAKRPQVQERLTQQILVAIQTVLGTDDVAVYVKATHYCVKSRGVQDYNSYTVTSAYGGKFQDDREIRKEFLAQINNNRR